MCSTGQKSTNVLCFSKIRKKKYTTIPVGNTKSYFYVCFFRKCWAVRSKRYEMLLLHTATLSRTFCYIYATNVLVRGYNKNKLASNTF